MEIIHDSTAVLNNMSNSFDKYVNKMDFLKIYLPLLFRNFIGKLGIAFVFYDVNNDICSALEMKTPALFFFHFFYLTVF